MAHQKTVSFRKQTAHQKNPSITKPAREVGRLKEISTETGQPADLSEVLENLLRSALAFIKVDQGGIHLINSQSGLLTVAASCGLPSDFIDQINNLQPGEGFSGYVAQTGEPLVIPDLAKDPRLTRTDAVDAGLHSAAVVPIRSKGKTLGTLFAITRAYREFQPIEVELLTSFGSQIGVTIENAHLLVDLQNRLAQLAALQETSRAVVSTLDLKELLELIIQQATALLRAEGGMLNLSNLDRLEDEVVACTGTARRTLGTKVALDQTLSGWVTLHNQPAIVNDVANDPRVYQQGRPNSFSKQLTNIVVAPLTIKGKVIGTLAMADKMGGTVDFEPADLDLLVGFASQAAAAIENARLYAAEKHRAEQEERNRLARELHDAVTQTLFSASLIAEAVPSVWENDPRQGRELLQELRRLSRGALAEMRTLLLELRPAALVETHLEDLLRQLGEAASGREGIPVTVLIEGSGTLPPEVHIALYRIAQEALNNVVKHARASQVTVRLGYTGSEPVDGRNGPGVLLSISDNGCGFDPAQAPPHRLGLRIMQERADAIGAKLWIASQPGKGTQVQMMWEEVEPGGRDG